ncbi:pyridoxal-phosphate dependent enzyme [Nannocystis bainbridge]|uniref:Pyridoxal-phosphate dependent enzyme n=1 Tax=Nannocystis bainbridge TaxID=2995303 RepID=A0ABT5EE42_9BACT|nr:pyridoxal-phosphate dependent enzyme [Nannocystis bainbridge]MDC0723718.1 pyridoxal-phosphate dependent enzyme [Nannocystis bainbridge]
MAEQWRSLIDRRFAASQSLLLRYHKVLAVPGPAVDVTLADLEACSHGEGATTFALAGEGEREVIVCDESSRMFTGTYKALDACLSLALLRRAKVTRVVASSGGNLSAALAAYATRAGIEAFLFQPRRTLYKQRADHFGAGVHLIAVDLPEPEIKQIARSFAERFGMAHVPDVRWRMAASAVRAMFVLESAAALGRIDCLAQTVCAGFGPAGIYQCFAALRRAGLLRRSEVPRFLGFQQEANAPIVRAWQAGEPTLGREHVRPEPDRYLEPGLYNTDPSREYARLAALLREVGGEMLALSEEDVARHGGPLLARMQAAGFEFSRLPGSDEVVEKTGLLTGVGVLKAIAEGQVTPGERAMLMLTGGVRELAGSAPPSPALTIDASRTEADWLDELGRTFGLATRARARA